MKSGVNLYQPLPPFRPRTTHDDDDDRLKRYDLGVYPQVFEVNKSIKASKNEIGNSGMPETFQDGVQYGRHL